MNLQFLETKFDPSGVKDDGSFVGYGSTFGNIDLGGDVVVKGAFAKSLETRPVRDVKLLWQHRQDEPIGTWKSIAEDDRGLKVEGQLILGVARAKEAYELMKGGALDGLSIGYRVKDAGMDKSTGARLLKQVELHEISVVTFGMNPAARVSAVKGEDMTERDFERILRDAGFSREFAKRATLHGFKAACEMSARDLRDAGKGENAAGLLAAIQRAEQALRT